jgi:fructose-specific phosphotransferase system IIC component
MSGASFLGTAGLIGMVVGGLLAGLCQRLVQRMRQIRQQRRLLAGMRPRRTVELAKNHQGR